MFSIYRHVVIRVNSFAAALRDDFTRLSLERHVVLMRACHSLSRRGFAPRVADRSSDCDLAGHARQRTAEDPWEAFIKMWKTGPRWHAF